MKTIIGLIGAKGSGKSTVATIISAQYEIEEIAIAKKLKDVCSEVFNIPRFKFDDPSWKEKELNNIVCLNRDNLTKILKFFDLSIDYKNMRKHIGKILYSPREVAQYIGSEVLRSLNLDIHCYFCLQMLDSDKIGVISDIRFPNELKFFKTYADNFILLYIKRDSAEEIAKIDAHVSESYLKQLSRGAALVDNNNISLKELSKRVLEALKGKIWEAD